jgi:tetrahydromethanopterin S-methyltransferase subunit B
MLMLTYGFVVGTVFGFLFGFIVCALVAMNQVESQYRTWRENHSTDA